MNYSQPRQVDPTSDRPDAGKWRYTTMNDGRVWPEGYCSPYRTCTVCRGASVIRGPEYDCYGCHGQGFVEVPNACRGHDTPEGAYQHQTEYVLAEKMRLDGQLSGEQRPCQVCQTWTQGLADVDGRSFVLCDEHRTRELVTELFGSVGDSFGTY